MFYTAGNLSREDVVSQLQNIVSPLGTINDIIAYAQRRGVYATRKITLVFDDQLDSYALIINS